MLKTRRLRFVCAAMTAALAATLLASAHAQTPTPTNPVVQHFLAYKAALERGALDEAEHEAQAALNASVERYGDQGRTAVLALNLAGVRLMQQNYDAATEPARKALALAEAQGEASGVDPLTARLMLGRAELRSGGSDAVDRLGKAVRESLDRPDLASEAYAAAVELGKYAFDSRRYRPSRDAWSAAARLAPTGTADPRVPVAAARIGQAAAGIMLQTTEPYRQQTGTNLDVRAGESTRYSEFDEMLVDAMDSIHHLAIEAAPGDGLTLAQTLYAQAIAWRNVVRAKQLSEDVEDLEPMKQPRYLDMEIGASRFTGAPCSVRLLASPAPQFPSKSRHDGGVGSVVLKLRSDGRGQVEQVQVASAVGGDDFVDSVTKVADRWRFQKIDGSPADCRMQMEVFTPVMYRYQ